MLKPLIGSTGGHSPVLYVCPLESVTKPQTIAQIASIAGNFAIFFSWKLQNCKLQIHSGFFESSLLHNAPIYTTSSILALRMMMMMAMTMAVVKLFHKLNTISEDFPGEKWEKRSNFSLLHKTTTHWLRARPAMICPCDPSGCGVELKLSLSSKFQTISRQSQSEEANRPTWRTLSRAYTLWMKYNQLGGMLQCGNGFGVCWWDWDRRPRADRGGSPRLVKAGW